MIGQFFTPEQVAACMYALLGKRCGRRLIDPAAGDGAFLKFAPKRFDLTACEIDPQYAASLRALAAPGQFAQGDALIALRSCWGSFDLAIGNPPFSAKSHLERRPEVLATYELGGGRTSQCLEVLFLELFVKLLRPGGRLAIILPEGMLRNRRFHCVRQWLLRQVKVDVIVGLPRDAFSGTTARTYILIAQKLSPGIRSRRAATSMLECDRMEGVAALPLLQWRKCESNWGRASLQERLDWLVAPDPIAAGTIALGEMFRLRRGRAQYAAQRELFSELRPERLLLLRAKNIAPDGALRLDANCAYISRSGAMFHQASVVQPGEILFVRVGARCYGRVALVPTGLEAQADDWLMILTPIAGVDSAAVVNWLNGPEGRSAVQRLAQGVGSISVSQAALAGLRIPLGVVRVGF
jgi:type I restriction enzyme M protein